MTYEQIDKKRKNIGSVVLFDISDRNNDGI